MTEIANTPTVIYLPALDYPPAVAKQVVAYEAAHERWRIAYTAVVTAQEAVASAPAEDAAALTAAAAAGKAHPGEKHAVAALRALDMAEENCRTAREAATAQTDVMRSTLADAVDELVPLVTAHVRATAGSYGAVLADCRAREEQARQALVNASGAMNVVLPHLATRYGLSQVWRGDSAATPPTWPAHPGVDIEGRLVRLEERVAQAQQARAKVSA